MSDTWSDIQEHKRRQESLRERLQRRRKERQGLSDQASEGNITHADIYYPKNCSVIRYCTFECQPIAGGVKHCSNTYEWHSNLFLFKDKYVGINEVAGNSVVIPSCMFSTVLQGSNSGTE